MDFNVFFLFFHSLQIWSQALMHLSNSLSDSSESDIFEQRSDVLDEINDISEESSDMFKESVGDSTSNEDHSFVSGGSDPIYKDADLTHNQSLLLLMAFVIKHQLTDQALNDFLTIMNMHLPTVVPETKYLFYKKFNHQAFTRHYFCGDCTFYFGPSEKCDADKVCQCHVPKSVDAAKTNKW